jgi:hypothetical protein
VKLKKVTTLSAEGQEVKLRAAKLHSFQNPYFIIMTAAISGGKQD